MQVHKVNNMFHNFIYEHSINSTMRPAQHIFNFYSPSDKSRVAKLVCHKSDVPIRPNYNNPVLAIDYLVVNDTNKGNGTKILKFAEEYSKKRGCNGFMTLQSDVGFTPQRIPHIFYRKFGFTTLDKKTDRRLDRFIKRNKDATWRDFPNMLMHYPPIADKKQSLVNKLWSYLTKLFK